MKRSRIRFGVTYNGRDIFSCRTLRSGVTVANPTFDYASAAQWWGIPWEAFEAMDSDVQAFHVAVFRTNRQIDAVLAHEQHRKMRAQAARARAKRGA